MAASRPSVLLVESAQDDREMYAEFLRAHNFAPLEVETTDEALRAASTADVIVTGIRVPGSFDGVELVRRLRHDGATKHKALIVLTACVFEPDLSRAHAAGCDVFLPKPCLPETLLAEIQSVLHRGRELRTQSERQRLRVAKASLKSTHLLEESRRLQARLREK